MSASWRTRTPWRKTSMTDIDEAIADLDFCTPYVMRLRIPSAAPGQISSSQAADAST